MVWEVFRLWVATHDMIGGSGYRSVVERQPSVQEALGPPPAPGSPGSTPSTRKPGCFVSLSTQHSEVEEGPGVQGHPQPQNKSEASLGYTRTLCTCI